MTHEKTILTNLSEWRPRGQETLTVKLPEWTVQFTADKCDELGCRLWEVAIRRQNDAEGVTLKSWAEALSQQFATHSEPLKVLEVDTEKNEALLRNETPIDRAGKHLYFEVLVQGTREAVLRRFQVADEVQAKREQTSFILTHEATATLVQALTGAE